MYNIFPFIIGFVAAVIGTLLPGLLNATTVKIATDEGENNAQKFMAGCLVIIFLQAYLAIFFSKIIDSSPFITNIIQEIGLVIFISLTIFFLLKYKKTKLKKVELENTKKTNRIVYGMLLALLNVFPIPFYVFVSITAAKFQLFEFKPLHNFLLSIGVILGTYSVFNFYIKMFKNKSIENSFFLKNINLILACITGFISLLTIYKLAPQFI